jgi:two-component sensor histidine kinase
MTLRPEPPISEVGTLLRELNHRVNNQFASVINLVSVDAVRADAAEAKSQLSRVVELLHRCAEVHRALLMPERETLIDAAVYLRRLCCALRGALLDRLDIQLKFEGALLPLQSERCWRFGLILNELVTNAMKHACFDGRAGAIKIKLARRGELVNCLVSDNGSASSCGRQGQGLRIISDLATSLGGRIEHSVGADFRSVVLSFLLTERERRASSSIASRRERVSHQLDAITSDVSAPRAGDGALDQESRPLVIADGAHHLPVHRGELPSACRSTDVLGGLLSPSYRMDAQ